MHQTHRLDVGEGLYLMSREELAAQPDAQLNYVQLPPDADEARPQQTAWRVLLALTGDNLGLLALEIQADVTVGWGAGGRFAPSLDLGALNANRLGLSRQHVLLRPTDRHLHLIDLDSTNGTRINDRTLWAGEAHTLAEGDRLTLARLTMEVVALERLPGVRPGPDTAQLPPLPDRPMRDDDPRQTRRLDD